MERRIYGELSLTSRETDFMDSSRGSEVIMGKVSEYQLSSAEKLRGGACE